MVSILWEMARFGKSHKPLAKVYLLIQATLLHTVGSIKMFCSLFELFGKLKYNFQFLLQQRVKFAVIGR